MTITRKWYCNCRGKKRELIFTELFDDEPIEPTCNRCGASPSSDPRHTISYMDINSSMD